METFERNIARKGVINLHISKLFGKEVEVFLHVDGLVIEIRRNEKKMTRSLDKNLDLVESIRDCLKTVVIDCQEVCDDYYIFIETEDISYLEDLFEMDGVVFDFEKCCVCLLSTQSKTKCNHAVCLACLPKCKKCPMCRVTF